MCQLLFLAPVDPAVRWRALLAAAHTHAASGLAAVTGEHYEGGHWLGSFATYLTTRRSRSATLRRTCLALVGGASTLLLYGSYVAIAGMAFKTLILPPLLGGFAGPLFAQGIVLRLRSGLSDSLNPVEWARLLISLLVIVMLTVLQVVPKMLPGAGYAMLGGALMSTAFVLFQGLP